MPESFELHGKIWVSSGYEQDYQNSIKNYPRLSQILRSYQQFPLQDSCSIYSSPQMKLCAF